MAEDVEKTPEESKDDILDGLYREVISREIANREGRFEGRSVVTELPEEGADFVTYGQSEMIEEFDKRLQKDKVKHRGINVGRYPIDDIEKVKKVRDIGNRQLSKATRARKLIEDSLHLPELPFENSLRSVEGSSVESREGAESSRGQAIPEIRYKPKAESKEETESSGGESNG